VELAFWLLRVYENWAPRFLFKWLRTRGLAFALEYVHAEDLQTNFVDIGPVNKARPPLRVSARLRARARRLLMRRRDAAVARARSHVVAASGRQSEPHPLAPLPPGDL
jgi:hypothetical protein